MKNISLFTVALFVIIGFTIFGATSQEDDIVAPFAITANPLPGNSEKVIYYHDPDFFQNVLDDMKESFNLSLHTYREVSITYLNELVSHNEDHSFQTVYQLALEESSYDNGDLMPIPFLKDGTLEGILLAKKADGKNLLWEFEYKEDKWELLRKKQEKGKRLK